MHAALITTTLALATFFAPTAPPARAVDVAGETPLFEQTLTTFEDMCEEQGHTWIRHVRFATLDAASHVEDRLELRTTTQKPNSAQVLDYLVNDVVMFTQVSSEALLPTSAGLRFLQDDGDAARVEKVLAAFAAAHPRIFAADVQAPQQTCGSFRGKHEEKTKCASISALGCLPKIAVVCLGAVGAGILCNYLVDKTCDENPDSCQPGWTTGD